MNCKEDIPVIEFTDFPIEVIYERIAPYVSNEETDSKVALRIDADERLAWNGVYGLDMVKISETKFQYVVSTPIPVDWALYARVNDKGKEAAGGDLHNGKRIIINGIELVKVGRDPLNNPGTVAYFIIKKDGTVIP
ncbi:MAG: hypothetical protein PVH84_11945 [Candidatus Aminicenantes bacterium]|jgi:hypothetical protein